MNNIEQILATIWCACYGSWQVISPQILWAEYSGWRWLEAVTCAERHPWRRNDCVYLD